MPMHQMLATAKELAKPSGQLMGDMLACAVRWCKLAASESSTPNFVRMCQARRVVLAWTSCQTFYLQMPSNKVQLASAKLCKCLQRHGEYKATTAASSAIWPRRASDRFYLLHPSRESLQALAVALAVPVLAHELLLVATRHLELFLRTLKRTLRLLQNAHACEDRLG